jgi:hypothetical protein
MKKHHRHENDCLNCGAELKGKFCHVCGQENLHVKEPFWHFLSHSISHYFHFDSKFFETIIPLLIKPGQLTLDYLAGRRARYLHPVSMYIFVSIIYFIVVPNLDHKSPEKHEKKEHLATEIKDSVKADLKKNGVVVTDTTDADTGKVVLKYDDKRFRSLSIIKKGVFLDSLTKLYKKHKTDTLKTEIKHYSNIVGTEANNVASYFGNDEESDTAAKTRSPAANFIRQMFSTKHRSEEFNKELEHYQPKVFFVLMPIFAFFLMVNFRRNHRYYVEHIIFTIHFFTAFFIFELVVKPINHYLFHENSDIFNWITFGVSFWYCYRALTTFYQRARWVTIRKLITLSIMMTVAYVISQGIIFTVVYLIS